MPLKSLLLAYGPISHRSALPLEVFTGTGADPRPRLKVDQADTAFYENRLFQLYHEYNILQGNSTWLKFVIPVDVILKRRSITHMSGKLRFSIQSGGVEAGTWLTKNAQTSRMNSMAEAPAYTRQVQGYYGGVYTGGTDLDVMLAETSNAQSVSVSLEAPEVGRSAGTYYIELRNTGTGDSAGLIRFIWEERQPTSPVLLET